MFFTRLECVHERRDIAVAEIVTKNIKARTAPKEPTKDPEMCQQNESNWPQNETQLAATLPLYAKYTTDAATEAPAAASAIAIFHAFKFNNTANKPYNQTLKITNYEQLIDIIYGNLSYKFFE